MFHLTIPFILRHVYRKLVNKCFPFFLFEKDWISVSGSHFFEQELIYESNSDMCEKLLNI